MQFKEYFKPKLFFSLMNEEHILCIQMKLTFISCVLLTRKQLLELTPFEPNVNLQQTRVKQIDEVVYVFLQNLHLDSNSLYECTTFTHHVVTLQLPYLIQSLKYKLKDGANQNIYLSNLFALKVANVTVSIINVSK